MPASDITIDLDRSSTPFPRSRRSERAHEEVEDFNRRNSSPRRFTSSPTRSRRLSPSPTRYRSTAPFTGSTRAHSPPRYRSPARITSSPRPRRISPSPPRYRSPTRLPSSTTRRAPSPSPYFRETRITEARRTTTYHPTSPVSRYTETRTTYRTPSFSSGPRPELSRPRTPPRGSIGSPSRRITSPRLVDIRSSETYSSSRRYDSYPSTTRSPARSGTLSPRSTDRNFFTRRY
ncbi:hypothetical protein QBC41DRAFT_305880 [Cercophora samala]|uniref:Uncharacterized protein n=1 Tax=Cercophora samala TaxID=330535 RepID=A0AA39Z7Q3_9PEZI|nr:hypothetical protein QBC41DRAFT_305880 [Cercophora samala]